MPASDLYLKLLGGFQLLQGAKPLLLSPVPQRLLAFLALQPNGVVDRTRLSGVLWPESTQARANASLRSALCRLQGKAANVVRATNDHVSLTAEVTVDFRIASSIAGKVVVAHQAASTPEQVLEIVEMLSNDLLPDWYDEWVLPEAETWRQFRLHALETLAEHFTASARYGDALVAALAATRAEPLRESARAALISVHLAQGNQSEAVREYERYSALLRAEVGLEPTDRLRDMLPLAALR